MTDKKIIKNFEDYGDGGYSLDLPNGIRTQKECKKFFIELNKLGGKNNNG